MTVDITCDPEYESRLSAAGLLGFDSLFTRRDLQVVKAKLAQRQTLSTSLPDGTTVFIKRYPRLRSRLLSKAPTPARREWLALQFLRNAGAPTMRPLALLEEREGRLVRRAALMTLGLNAPHTLEEVANEAMAPARRHALARDLGRITRRMHDAGVNHRDYYFVHIRVGAGDKLYITDLNRADLRRVVPQRWIVKDLAALHFSAPPGVTSADRVRFLRAYTGKPLRELRAMIRAILRKAERMESHTRKKVQAGEANYHLPGARDVH